MQSAVCRDQSPRGPGHGLCDLLSARGHGESAQGVARRSALDRTSGSQFWANQFRVLRRRRPMSCCRRCGNRPTARTALARRCLRCGSGCSRWPCGSNARCAASCCTYPARPPGAQPGTGGRSRRRGTRLTAHPGSYRTVAQRDQTGAVCRESPAQDVRRPPDHSKHRKGGTSTPNRYRAKGHRNCPLIQNGFHVPSDHRSWQMWVRGWKFLQDLWTANQRFRKALSPSYSSALELTQAHSSQGLCETRSLTGVGWNELQ